MRGANVHTSHNIYINRPSFRILQLITYLDDMSDVLPLDWL